MIGSRELPRAHHRPSQARRGRDPQAGDELAMLGGCESFHVALDMVIRQRRLTLEAVQRRMAAHGVTVSQATLSYWRRGQRRPVGERSIRAVRALELSLGLPQGTLARLAVPHQSNGAANGKSGPVGLATALQVEPSCLAVFKGLDMDANSKLSIMSIHTELLIDQQRREQWVMSRISVISKVDGVDRWSFFFDPKAGSGHRPMLTETECCQVGRVRFDAEHDLLGVELRFDYQLRVGDSYAFAYRTEYDGTKPRGTFFQQGLRAPVQHLLMQVHFHPESIPVRCYQYNQVDEAGHARGETELPIGASRSCHMLTPNAQPGIHGVRWEWD